MKLFQVKINSLTVAPQAPQQDIYHYMCANSIEEARSLFQSLNICDPYSNMVTECTSKEDLEREITLSHGKYKAKDFLAPWL